MALRCDRKSRSFYDCNRSNAVAFACKDFNQLAHAARRVPGCEDHPVATLSDNQDALEPSLTGTRKGRKFCILVTESVDIFRSSR